MIHNQISWETLPCKGNRIILGNASKTFCVENNNIVPPAANEKSFFEHTWSMIGDYLQGLPDVGMENMTVTQEAGSHPAVIALISICSRNGGGHGPGRHPTILRVRVNPATTTGTIVLLDNVHPRQGYSAVQLMECARRPEMLIDESARNQILKIIQRMNMKLLWDAHPNNQFVPYIRMTPNQNEGNNP